MDSKDNLHIVDGFPDDQRDVVVGLFWQAFRAKLATVMNPEMKALAFLGRVADPSHVLCAVDDDGQVVGIAGFKTSSGAFVGGDLSDLQAAYGSIGGLWRGLVLSLLERDLEPGVLLMDGIVVRDSFRGRGIGTQLLNAIKDTARVRGCSTVRLDVIDSNVRARALYERQGFEPVGETHLGPFRYLFGFSSALQMQARV